MFARTIKAPVLQTSRHPSELGSKNCMRAMTINRTIDYGINNIYTLHLVTRSVIDTDSCGMCWTFLAKQRWREYCTVVVYRNVSRYGYCVSSVYCTVWCVSRHMYRCTGVPVYRCTGVPVYRCSCVPVYRCTGVPVYRCTGVPVYRCTGVLFLL